MKTLAALLLPLLILSGARATVTNVAWYRLGENDAGAASGLAVTNTTADFAGTKHLKQFGNPIYTNAVSTTASNRVGSSLAVHFNGSSQFLSNAVVTTAVNNFGIEAWVKPNTTSFGPRIIAQNGFAPNGGWALYQLGGNYLAFFGGQFEFGSGTASPGIWAHLALVRDNGTATFYVNGIASGTALSTPSPATGGFAIGATPQPPAEAFFNGAIDEVRVFTFAPGQFSTNDLLVNLQLVATTLPATGVTATTAILNGSANPASLPASGWFEWGTTTNYGNATSMQPLGSGLSNTNFSQAINGLAGGFTYHFRAVGSNYQRQVVGSNVTFTTANGPSVASGPVGGGQPIDLRQPALELNYIICTNGFYPNQGGNTQPPFFGEVRLFAGNFAPAGWTMCHGQLINFTNNLSLFSIIGTTYGGDGVVTMALPDFRSRSPVSMGQGQSLSQVSIGEMSGSAQVTLFLSSIPIHTHPLLPPYSGNSGSAGFSAPRPNRQPYLGISSLIYLSGYYPSSGQPVLEPFIGQMPLFAGSYGFGNAVLTEGQVLPINQNAALYSLLGTNYGGNGQTTLGLPDLRGRSPMGVGQGPGLSARTLGQKAGAESVTMSIAQMPAHQHPLPSVPPISRFTGVAGSNQPQSIVQPALGVRFLICTIGEVPSTSVPATNKMVGEIQAYAGTTTPSDWAACDGQLLTVAAYPALFSVISNWFGGDGVTTFALPNLASRIPVGSPNGQPGAIYGTEQFVLTEAQLPAHTHTVPALDYPAWCDALGLVGVVAAFDHDADGDGARNGFEWATGTNPTNATSSAALTIVAIGEQAKLQFTRNTNATDISLHLQRTTNLTSSNFWSGLTTNIAGAWTKPGIVNETGTGNPKAVEISDPLTNNAAADYRLKVTRP